ncbi:hypothetical protein [Saccharolobus islandicus]|uniref:Uncharacterized protein n=1 Tax=Saccharolobus islandicus (strain M.16.27) TaxID=427318 RepID=C3N203_SACI3|nr:hypothetical protein [Sulfolobus islandicus]ACP54413.1 hypothetical protein M1627_0398 [Sulfolobus islandicus M.16.27]
MEQQLIIYAGARKIRKNGKYYLITIKNETMRFLNNPKYVLVVLKYENKEIPIGVREIVKRRTTNSKGVFTIYTVSIPKYLTPYLKLNNLIDKKLDVILIPFDNLEVI